MRDKNYSVLFVFNDYLCLGWIAQQHGYQVSLFLAGIFMSLSGFITILIPLINYLRKKHTHANVEQRFQTINAIL
jgi:hypothetical protein